VGLTVLLQGERGDVHQSVADPSNILHRLLPSDEDVTFVMVNDIDWYGDTLFNRPQMTRFLDEWRRLRSRAEEQGALDIHGRIEAMAIRVHDGVHLYLKFVGD
jgi:hypothetical protein